MTDAAATQLQRELETTPVGFAEFVLGIKDLYKGLDENNKPDGSPDWQARALAPLHRAIGSRKKLTQIAVSSPNGGGRSTRVIPCAALWWASINPRGRVVITTKDGKQLNEQIIPAIEKLLPNFPSWAKPVKSPYFKLITAHGGSIIAYTTDDAGRVEGSHTDGIDSPLLIIVDEAKSVDEKIFDGIDRCTYDALMYCSSPGLMMGTFYNAFTKNGSQFVKIKAGLKDCPHIPKEKIDRTITKYGLDHPFTQSSVFGEFMSQDDENQFAVPLESLDRCLRNPPRHIPGMRVGFCDFAEGSAEHVLAVRNGNKIEIAAAWRESNKDAAANRFVREFKKAGLKQEQVFGDAADLEMWKLLVDSGWTINRQNFGAPAKNSEEFISWGAEVWIEGGIQIGKCEVILPADDEELKAQLTTRKRGIGSRGRQNVEEKHELRKRNIPSPDRADAVLGAMAVFDSEAVYGKQPFSIPSGIFSEGHSDHFEHGNVLEEIGAEAGL